MPAILPEAGGIVRIDGGCPLFRFPPNRPNRIGGFLLLTPKAVIICACVTIEFLLLVDACVTKLLETAFAKAAELSPAEQDLLASRVLAELAEEDAFDRAIAASSDKLAALAREALAEYHSGQTQELDPERL